MARRMDISGEVRLSDSVGAAVPRRRGDDVARTYPYRSAKDIALFDRVDAAVARAATQFALWQAWDTEYFASTAGAQVLAEQLADQQ